MFESQWYIGEDQPVDDVNSCRPYIFPPAILLPSTRPYADVDWKSSPIINNLNALLGSKKRMATRRRRRHRQNWYDERSTFLAARTPLAAVNTFPAARACVGADFIYIYIYLFAGSLLHQPVVPSPCKSVSETKAPTSFDFSYRHIDYHIHVESLKVYFTFSSSSFFLSKLQVSSEKRSECWAENDEGPPWIPWDFLQTNVSWFRGVFHDGPSQTEFTDLSEKPQYGNKN